MADAKVSKTFDHNGRVGSTPTFGTIYLEFKADVSRVVALKHPPADL